MPKIAYTTDVHANLGSRRGLVLADKIAAARKKKVKAFFLGGDTFPLQSNHWPTLKQAPASKIEIKKMEDDSKELVDKFCPGIVAAADGMPIFILKGNADHVAYEYMRQSFPNDFIFVQNSSPISLYDMYVLGQGGIPVVPGAETDIAEHNPWYKGIMQKSEYDTLIQNAKPLYSWVEVIWMTHAPAFGTLDAYIDDKKPQGSKTVLDFIVAQKPLIHLTGHIHGGATQEAEGNKSYRPFSVINKVTLSINTGSEKIGDDIKMLVINPELAYDLRIDGELEQRAQECISIIP